MSGESTPKPDNARTGFNPVSAETFYKETRDQIKHEDNLINNRMTWMIGLQALLFSAYGFSLSAQATITSSNISFMQITARRDVISTHMFADSTLKLITDQIKEVEHIIANARTGFALMGMLSAFVILLGLTAASLSMGGLVNKWMNKYPEEKKLYPQIIGKISLFDKLGRYLGLIPTFTLPCTCIFVWYFLEGGTYLVQELAKSIEYFLVGWIFVIPVLWLGGLAEKRREKSG